MQNRLANDEHDSFLRRSSIRILESLGLQGIAILISITFGIISFVISAPILILNGYVLMKLWSWFIAPLGVVNLHLGLAVGITCFINFLNANLSKESTLTDTRAYDQNYEPDGMRDISSVIFKAWRMKMYFPLASLASAWIVHVFMNDITAVFSVVSKLV